MMAKQAQTLFLEEWLTFNSDGSSNISAIQSSSSSARAIIQAWGDLRDSLKHNSFQPRHLQSLQVLHNSQSSVYVSDPQAKLLLSILSSKDLAVPHESYPFLLRLLYIWVRKSSKPSSVLIDSAVVMLHHLFSLHIDSEQSPFFYSEAFLLAGALTYVPSTSEKSKTDCLELLSRLLQEEYPYIFISKGHTAKFLAGTGYALSSSGPVHLLRILDSLFNIWNRKDAPSGSVSDGLMILHLIEWVLYGFVKSHSSEKISVLTREILRTSKPPYASFAVLMAAAGVLRASSRSVSSVLMEARSSAEECIGSVARNLISRTEGCNISESQPGNILLLHCISLALARSGPVSFQVSLLMCLSSALLNEIFPLQRFYAKILKNYHNSSTSVAINEVNEHLSNAIFKEAGAISAVFCNQYVSADEGSKSIVENYIWNYCQDVYSLHRKVGLVLRGIEVELIGNLEKIAESAFLMVVVFALEVTKQRLHSRFSRETQLEVSVRILIAFSCFEYFRRMRLSEYMDTIRKVVISVQENKLACISFVKSIPSYSQLINKDGSFSLHKIDYMWSKDDVQTARILFYLRVIPTCIEQVPASLFREVVAPTMFLYMGHPNGKVARASHSLFMAFVSSAKDSDDEERLSLKEQLVFFYMQRSLEGYPGLTPFEGMASGVAALVRYLPAGSPSTFYCIHSLVERANNLRSEIMAGDNEAWTNWQEEVEPCKKLLELLMRLLSLVDIQELFLAGTDTSTITTEWALSELISHPQKMLKLRDEISETVRKEGTIEETEILRLPYLQAVVKETMRLHLAVPFLVPHKTEKDARINEYIIPKNTQVLVNAWAIARDSNTWDKPTCFMPERFLKREVDFKGQHFSFLPFGSGRRMCPGLPLAHRVVSLMIASLVYHFEWKLPNESTEPVDMNETFSLTLQKAKPLVAVPKMARP